MNAEIKLSGIKVASRIGVSKEERAIPQLLEIEALFTTDISEAAASDDISKTVDYQQVAKTISDLASLREYCLVETLATELCRQLLRLPRIDSVRLKIIKRPEALEGFADNVAIELGPLKLADF